MWHISKICLIFFLTAKKKKGLKISLWEIACMFIIENSSMWPCSNQINSVYCSAVSGNVLWSVNNMVFLQKDALCKNTKIANIEFEGITVHNCKWGTHWCNYKHIGRAHVHRDSIRSGSALTKDRNLCGHRGQHENQPTANLSACTGYDL